MILDKLVEKKDLEAYLRLRADFLKSEMESEILKLEPQDREFIRERFKGRISELENTIKTVKNDTLKKDSKWYYKQTHIKDVEYDKIKWCGCGNELVFKDDIKYGSCAICRHLDEGLSGD